MGTPAPLKGGDPFPLKKTCSMCHQNVLFWVMMLVLFVQSNFWEKLSSARFTGVSNEYLLIKSADRFTSSPSINYHFDTRFDNNLITKIKMPRCFGAFFIWGRKSYSSSSNCNTSRLDNNKFTSSLLPTIISLYTLAPVPAGIRLPVITFSFKPIRLSTLPLIAA